MKTETELREVFEKIEPVPEDMYWNDSNTYWNGKLTWYGCLVSYKGGKDTFNIYNAKWQGFKQATEYYEQQLAEKDAEIARLNELVYQLQTDIIGITE